MRHVGFANRKVERRCVAHFARFETAGNLLSSLQMALEVVIKSAEEKQEELVVPVVVTPSAQVAAPPYPHVSAQAAVLPVSTPSVQDQQVNVLALPMPKFADAPPLPRAEDIIRRRNGGVVVKQEASESSSRSNPCDYVMNTFAFCGDILSSCLSSLWGSKKPKPEKPKPSANNKRVLHHSARPYK